MKLLTYSSVNEIIGTRLDYMSFFYSSLMRQFNYVKVDEAIMVSIKIKNVVRLSCILANEFRMD